MISSTPSIHTAALGPDKLRVSEERYRLLVQSVKDYAIFMLDREGRVKTWNAGAEAIKGYHSEEIIGRHIEAFYLPEERAAHKPQQLLDEAARAGSIEDLGWRVRKNGTHFWADVVITAIRDDAGRLIGFSKVTRDLTAKRAADEALRQSEERFRVLVQTVRDHAIFMLDPQGRVASWNAGAARITGYTPEEIIGQHFSRFYLPEETTRRKWEKELEVALLNGKFEEEGWRLGKDGTRFPARVVIQPLYDQHHKLLGFAQVTRDLTEVQATEAERIRLAQAEEAIRLRDEFLSIASHELRTPLTSIQLQLQTLLRETSSLDEHIKQRAERAFRSGERLADLVETLLDVSRIASGNLTLMPTKFDLGLAAAEVVDQLREQAAQEGCELTLHTEGEVVGEWDKVRIEQILTNLLSNGIKYAAGAPIDVVVKADRGSAILIVSDQGPGIPLEDRARIFGRFERAVSMRHFGGMGLGLYVAQQIADAHGGSIAVEAVQPHGARFLVQLPRPTPSPTSAVTAT